MDSVSTYFFALVKLTTDIIYGRYITYQSYTIKMHSAVKDVFLGRLVILLCVCQGITRE